MRASDLIHKATLHGWMLADEVLSIADNGC